MLMLSLAFWQLLLAHPVPMGTGLGNLHHATLRCGIDLMYGLQKQFIQIKQMMWMALWPLTGCGTCLGRESTWNMWTFYLNAPSIFIYLFVYYYPPFPPTQFAFADFQLSLITWLLRRVKVPWRLVKPTGASFWTCAHAVSQGSVTHRSIYPIPHTWSLTPTIG